MKTIATLEDILKSSDTPIDLSEWANQLVDLQDASVDEVNQILKNNSVKITDPYEVLDKLLSSTTIPFYFSARSYSTIILCFMICIEDSKLNNNFIKARKLMLKLIDWMHHRYELAAETIKINLYLLDDDMLEYWTDIADGKYKDGMVKSGLFIEKEYDDLSKNFGKVNIYEELKVWCKCLPKPRRKIIESYLPYLKKNPMQKVVFGSEVGLTKFKMICAKFQQEHGKEFPSFMKNALLTGIAIFFEDNK